MSYVDLAGGFPVVAQHLLESKVVVESLVMFWKEFTIIEETYAKSLRELLGNPAASFRTSILHRFTGFFNSDSGFEEGKSVKNGWDQVKDEIEGVAGFHASLATNLKREIINKLESYLSESEPRKKQVVNRGRTSLVDIKKVQINLEKEREKYQKLTKEVESLMKNMSDASLSASRNSKVQSQVTTLKKEVDVCLSKYKSYVEEHRGVHQQYYSKQQPLIMREMQAIEVERIELIKMGIEQFNELFVAVVPILKKGYTKIKSEVENISHETDIKDFVDSQSEYLPVPSLPSPDPSGEPEPQLKQSQETKQAKGTEKERQKDKEKQMEKERDDPEEDAPPHLNGTTTMHERVPRSPPAEVSAARTSAAKLEPEPPETKTTTDPFELTPLDGSATNGTTDKHHHRTSSLDERDVKPSTRPTNPDKSKRASTKAPKDTAPETIEDVPIMEAPRSRRRAQTQPVPPPQDDVEEETETTPHQEDERATKRESNITPAHQLVPPEQTSPKMRPTKPTHLNKPARASSEYEPSFLDSITNQTNPSANNRSTEQPNGHAQNDHKPLEETSTKAPESTITIPTTNRFSSGTFRTSNAISSKINRFNQSTYSSTTFKRDDLSYSSKTTLDGNIPTSTSTSPPPPTSTSTSTSTSPIATIHTTSNSSSAPRAISKSYEASSRREAVPLPQNSRDKAPEVRNERDKGQEARNQIEKEQEERTGEKENHSEARSQRARERELPGVPRIERIPEARRATSEREKSPVRGAKSEKRPEPELQPMNGRTRSPQKDEREREEAPKPTVQATSTRSPLTRTKSVPNFPVVEELPDSEEKDEAELLLEALRLTAQTNDIYCLFGIDAATPMDEIGKRRRQLTQLLHPDNFVKGSEEWNDAQQRMARVNQAYNNVLRKDAARALYDKIAMYRQSYAKLLRKSDGVLQTAANNLYSLRESLRTTNMPHFLVDELDQSLTMLRVCRGVRPQL